MVEDQLAYEELVGVRKLPPQTPGWQEKHDAALLVCIRTPQAMAATGVAILELCNRLINTINNRLISELSVCADLAMATVRCATHNVQANLREVPAGQWQAMEQAANSVLGHAIGLIQYVEQRMRKA